MSACIGCGCSVSRSGRRGPPLKWCADCSRRTGRKRRTEKQCRVCERTFTGPLRQPTCGRSCGKRISRVLVKCKRCGTGMMLPPYIAAPRRFCSRACANRTAGDGRMRVQRAQCRGCGGVYRPKRSERSAYCSRDCYFASKRQRRLRRIAGEAGPGAVVNAGNLVEQSKGIR